VEKRNRIFTRFLKGDSTGLTEKGMRILRFY
jgi:hypothetical protein